MEPCCPGVRLWPDFFDISADCPYGLRSTAVYRQALLGSLPDRLMDALLASGFRRNGNTMYTMACRGCRACVPIRLRPEEFRPNRTQRRTWKQNQDILITTGPVRITPGRLALCDAFLRQRYPGKGNTAIDYYRGFFINAITNTFEVVYRDQKRLLGTAIIDLTATGLNAVYFYFDPAESRRSLGIFNILHLLDLAKRHHLQHLYLGYWIQGAPGMEYKADFKPHYLLQASGWQRVGRKNPGKGPGRFD